MTQLEEYFTILFSLKGRKISLDELITGLIILGTRG